MSVEVGEGVIYHWFDIREDQLEDIQSWTDAAQKIREVTDDVLRIAIANAPSGPPRAGQAKIRNSHYKAGTSFAGRFRYRQVVGNRAKHAVWVHQGTLGMSFIVSGSWMGPINSTGGYRSVNIPRGKKWANSGSGGRTPNRNRVAYFYYFTFGGQAAQPWLEEAGLEAYSLPGNH